MKICTWCPNRVVVPKKNVNPLSSSETSVSVSSTSMESHTKSAFVENYLFETSDNIKCFHDDTPVFLAAVEFVMETFDWRPPKFYFRILKTWLWRVLVTHNCDCCNLWSSSKVRQKKKLKQTAKSVSVIRTSKQTKSIIHAEILKKSVNHWAFKICQSAKCVLKIRNPSSFF